MEPPAERPKSPCRIAIDTGGTFTDGVAMFADGATRHIKVLSSAALRGRLERQLGPRELLIQLPQSRLTPGLLVNFRIRRPGGKDLARIHDHSEPMRILLDSDVSLQPGAPIELAAPFDAPRLALHLLLGTTEGASFEDVAVRVATTRGTNALLEDRGRPFALVLDEGLEDLLEIGDQSRPDLFALDIRRERLTPRIVVGVGGRLQADGTPLEEISDEQLDRLADQLREIGASTVGIALAHAWRSPRRETVIADALRARGLDNIICSNELSRADQLLPRAETVAVEATLAPILDQFIDEVLPPSQRRPGALMVMTSAGGLEPAESFRAKDGLLSGPAGGVTGAARSAHQCGIDRILGFDMGGTSTDVSRHDVEVIYRFETRVGPARIQAPCVAIESVAAGGGSICHVTDEGLAVGPRSAGASPGPACYGAGGPLTITDVNLLLGRADPDHFGIPIELEHAERAFESLREELQKRGFGAPDRLAILEGLRDIADERMAEAMRSISIREGADPRRHALVPFGGAGGQHGCAIAERLDIDTILVPLQTGVLSAVGLLHASEERFAERTFLEPLESRSTSLDTIVEELETEALDELSQEGGTIRRRIIALRLAGQDAVIQLDHEDGVHPGPAFAAAFELLYGYAPPKRPIELAWVRVVASEPAEPLKMVERLETPTETPQPNHHLSMQIRGSRSEAPVFKREQLPIGAGIAGPALIQDAGATTVVDPGWHGLVQPDGALLLTRDRRSIEGAPTLQGAQGAAAAELVSARLTAIATGMGQLLERTALSVNVKQRLDFSCAILDENGRLLVNAPHMPIHLGSMGICVRRTVEQLDPGPRDVLVTNHPACGGSHLPDVTTIAPVHEEVDGGRRLGFVAVRAHHAEIGGTRPGSTPPFARHLVEEGVLIPPTRIIADGQERFEDVSRMLHEARWPSRRPQENLADLAAQVASTRHGVERIRELATALGSSQYRVLAGAVHANAAAAAREAIARIGPFEKTAEQKLDDGALIKLRTSSDGERLTLDFTGTSSMHPGNFNAPVAIVTGATVYLMRLLADRPLPLNEGLLEPVDIVVPEGLLDPSFSGDSTRDPAVCGGNTETSQRLVDTLILAFELAASSQGTMNNLLLGNDSFGYYETICGGAGATPNAPGCSAVHTHMTNTRITDPETLEARYPVRLECFKIRKDSGGAGRHAGGDGVVRTIRALAPLEVSLVSQHRREMPFGLSGGDPGQPGSGRVVRTDGSVEELGASAEFTLAPGEIVEISTPGGGGFGATST